MDRTRDLQIFSLTLSQLSYPRDLTVEAEMFYFTVNICNKFYLVSFLLLNKTIYNITSYNIQSTDSLFR